MAIYNMSPIDAANNSLEVAVAVNDSSGGWLYGGMLLVFFCVVFMIGTFKYDIEDVLIADGLLTAVIGGMMWSVELLPWHIIIYPSLLCFAGIIYKIWGRS